MSVQESKLSFMDDAYDIVNGDKPIIDNTILKRKQKRFNPSMDLSKYSSPKRDEKKLETLEDIIKNHISKNETVLLVKFGLEKILDNIVCFKSLDYVPIQIMPILERSANLGAQNAKIVHKKQKYVFNKALKNLSINFKDFKKYYIEKFEIDCYDQDKFNNNDLDEVSLNGLNINPDYNSKMSLDAHNNLYKSLISYFELSQRMMKIEFVYKNLNFGQNDYDKNSKYIDNRQPTSIQPQYNNPIEKSIFKKRNKSEILDNNNPYNLSGIEEIRRLSQNQNPGFPMKNSPYINISSNLIQSSKSDFSKLKGFDIRVNKSRDKLKTPQKLSLQNSGIENSQYKKYNKLSSFQGPIKAATKLKILRSKPDVNISELKKHQTFTDNSYSNKQVVEIERLISKKNSLKKIQHKVLYDDDI